ncbi:MAG TPA: LamG-like jellyroll fold domain-containing protein, partial [Candidatus Kapabacteria bacterium]|nr:LamG-like jellyroll fold domain-containing protein [Candidatus Kapabacteria bacterium]
MNYRLLLFPILLLFAHPAAHAQTQPLDTVVVQTLTYDSIGRAGVYQFPDTGTFEKVIMQYSMRCHHALVSNSTKTEQGCGQWDYNCETYLWDSTRTDSLDNIAPSAVISNYPANTNFPYTTKATSSITRRDEKLVRYPSGTKFLWDTAITRGGPGLPLVVRGYDRMHRMYFVLPANDPLWSHFNTSSLLNGIVLNVASGADTLRDLRIRMHLVKPGSYNALSIYQDASFAEVYHATTFLSIASDTLLFYNPFLWDGKSDVVMEISYSGNSAGSVELLGTDSSVWVTSTSGEYALSFASSERISIPMPALQSVSNALTIAFWAYGDTSYLPGSNSVFCEGLDAKGGRQINIHLPWSDNNVYWDCGGDTVGNFDRIQKTAAKTDASGRWNYWAFTKDAVTGKMAIYLNGALWMSDTGKYRTIHATRMMLGGAISSTIGYFGDVRQFAMFNRALDSNTIRAMMINDSAIAQSNPITYFTFNEGSGSTFANSAAGMPSASMLGIPVWHSVRGEDLPNNFELQQARPWLTLIQLADSIKPQITDRYTYDTIPDHAHIVTNYRIGHNYAFHQNDTVVAIDTVYGDYLATKSYTYDETGKKVDSVNVAAQDTIKP